METFYTISFILLAGLVLGLELWKRKTDTKNVVSSASFLSFRNNYLIVYSLMMAGDWLQGPYVYSLYQHYGYQVHDIGRLFIAGFGSSMIFGTVAGSLADKHGRKAAALLYVATYTLSCMTKHWGVYGVLMMGRVLGGIATSLLFSAFESWLVAEHIKRGYDMDWLGDTFSRAVQLGNGFVAILAGLLANTLVETLALGPVAPFDAAAVLLCIGGGIIVVTWPENRGDASSGRGIVSQLQSAVVCIRSDARIFYLGAMQGLFEGAMYTFVFLWTPALAPRGESIPHGFIFALFMIASMSGSALAGGLLNQGIKPEAYMQWVFALASLCMLVPVTFHLTVAPVTDLSGTVGGITGAGMVQCVAFCAFELLVGVFWPSMMTMRAKYLPEDLRSTLINCFRIPLNVFVCAILFNVSKYPLAVMFGLCSAFLALAYVCQRALCHLTRFHIRPKSPMSEKAGLLQGEDRT